MSHKKRITIEVDPLIATTTISSMRILMYQTFNKINSLPENEFKLYTYEMQVEMDKVMHEMYEKCIEASGLREMMANDPEGVALISKAIDECGLAEKMGCA